MLHLRLFKIGRSWAWLSNIWLWRVHAPIQNNNLLARTFVCNVIIAFESSSISAAWVHGKYVRFNPTNSKPTHYESIIVIAIVHKLKKSRILNRTVTSLHRWAQDSPEDCEPVLVTKPKPTASICNACFYIQRGSFNCHQGELSAKMANYPDVKEKLLGNRVMFSSFCSGVQNKCQRKFILQTESMHICHWQT